MRDTDWMGRALCPSWPTLPWTANAKPEQGAVTEMTLICAECPVRGHCAEYALDTGQQSGMYAGVWIPHRWWGHRTSAWYDARRQLAALVRPVAQW